MFIHIFQYALKGLCRSKVIVFWTLFFPIALSTFMYLSFINVSDTMEKVNVIPVAVVQEKETTAFDDMLGDVSGKGENQLLKVIRTSEEKAEALLEGREVRGIIYTGDQLSLRVAENGVEQTMLQMILNQFKQHEKVIADVRKDHPEKLDQALKALSEELTYVVENKTTDGNQDSMVNYFYAVFALTCLLASLSGYDRIVKIQENISPLAQRRSVSPIHKMKGILADFLACELLQFSVVCLLFFYMKVILGIQLGNKYPAILLLLFLGTSLGVLVGILIGTLPWYGEVVKIGIITAIVLVFCTLSDLMVDGIRDAVEHNIPWLNDINPAALIVDSFYALNIYDNYVRFGENMMRLGGIAVLLLFICFCIVRRRRYASL